MAAHFAPNHNGAYILDARQHIGSPGTSGSSVRCAKTIVGVSTGPADNGGLTGYDRPVSQVLEIVPLNDPTRLHVGDTLSVLVLFKGTALPGAFLTVIPRGKVLPRLGVENPYDLVTDSQGKANFTFHEPNYHLLVVHLETEEPGGASNGAPQKTEYAGDLTVMVKPKA